MSSINGNLRIRVPRSAFDFISRCDIRPSALNSEQFQWRVRSADERKSAAGVFVALSRDESGAVTFTPLAGRTQVGRALRELKKRPPPVLGERAFYSRNAIHSSESSASLVRAVFLKAVAERTFFSPGYGRINPVASYQSRWLTMSGFSASGV